MLVTGATGSFGSAFVKMLLETEDVGQIRVVSRDELKQVELRRRLQDRRVRMFPGDVRDLDRLREVMYGVDLVVHCAALKQVPILEQNPMEAVKTNILGSDNVVRAAREAGVERVIALSSDKAVSPANLYGCSKMAMERLVTAANGSGTTSFSCVRYGNVTASRGSAIPLFFEQRSRGVVTLTDSRMTRFWITVSAAVGFVKACVERQVGGEVFVPKLPSVRITDLVSVIAPDCEIQEIGVRPGEKLHELLLSEDEARHTLEAEGYYIVVPEQSWWKADLGLPSVSIKTAYSSGSNDQWLTQEDIARLLPGAVAEARPYDPVVDATVQDAPVRA